MQPLQGQFCAQRILELRRIVGGRIGATTGDDDGGRADDEESRAERESGHLGTGAGQIAAPVVALPTSMGYSVAAGGHAAALTMLSARAPGIGVVNIDTGYGAGHLAAQIARWAPAPDQQEATEPPPR